jgi:hypothetical protein
MENNSQSGIVGVVSSTALLANAVSQLQEQEKLSRAIGAKCKKKKNATMAKYYEGHADALKQVRDYLCANAKGQR